MHDYKYIKQKSVYILHLKYCKYTQNIIKSHILFYTIHKR